MVKWSPGCNCSCLTCESCGGTPFTSVFFNITADSSAHSCCAEFIGSYELVQDGSNPCRWTFADYDIAGLDETVCDNYVIDIDLTFTTTGFSGSLFLERRTPPNPGGSALSTFMTFSGSCSTWTMTITYTFPGNPNNCLPTATLSVS